MKKMILILLTAFLFIPEMTEAQPGSLDTVQVKPFSMRLSEWYYYSSYWYGSTDSADIQFLKTVRTAIKAASNPTLTTQISLDSIAGDIVIKIYEINRKIPNGEGDEVGNSAVNAIRNISHPVIQYHIGTIDGVYNREFIRHRKLGKNVTMDN